MERLTTDQENALFSCFNIFYAKGGEIWVRGGGPYPEYQDVTLVQWIRSAAQKHGLNIMAEDPEHLGDEMYDALQDGDETVEGIVALLHAAAVQATEMRERLKPIEDILEDDYDLDRLRELVEADREGRCRIHPKPENNTCGSCGHFQRILGRRCGTCDVHSKYRDRYGRVDDRRGAFTPPQSKKACKSYKPREE
ncbi:hypothetical protein [Pseudoflavonifractor sp. An85]|uniref:hypothetical protein n=1 Tax=Pseudoflavonifractor sp. An85 TaxID=1965661 RepID=UPI000B399471|nr:hypothetical protein [Pseudoflavonifractor sp. An85]OUN24577.1 hypothetical protein B5G37_07245 [Pseudoflavonifractor sp. An85]